MSFSLIQGCSTPCPWARSSHDIQPTEVPTSLKIWWQGSGGSNCCFHAAKFLDPWGDPWARQHTRLPCGGGLQLNLGTQGLAEDGAGPELQHGAEWGQHRTQGSGVRLQSGGAGLILSHRVQSCLWIGPVPLTQPQHQQVEHLCFNIKCWYSFLQGFLQTLGKAS